MTIRLGLAAVIALSVVGCKKDEAPPPVAPKVEAPPPAVPAEPELLAAEPLPTPPLGLPEVKAPEDNPTTAEKADLGYQLFFDQRLSKDGSMACAGCHHVDKALTSGLATDAKVGGGLNTRNAPSMLNLGTHTSFYWDGRMPTLEAVSLAAWKGQLGADPDAVAKALNEVPVYKKLFDRAFGSTDGATADAIPKALAAWLRTAQSGNSAYDRFAAGDTGALSEDAKRGWAVFQKAKCATCHVPPLFTDSDFHNVGVGDDAGRKNHTQADGDTGRFKTPSLRNVSLTGPYLHDGSAATLTEAVELMVKGGKKNKHLDKLLKPFKPGKRDVADLVAFLESLTGESTYPGEPELP